MRLRTLTFAAVLGLAGCGYVGDVQPPALNIPEPVKAAKAVQRGDAILVTFTLPRQTTEGLPLKVELAEAAIGATPAGKIDWEAWGDSARKVNVPDAEPGATVTVSLPATGFAGRNVAIAVRLLQQKGRWSDWAPALYVAAIAPLQTPVGFTAAADPNGVRLTWTPFSNLRYRVLREAAGEKELTVLKEDVTSPFVDQTAKYGTAYRYAVQGYLPGTSAESELSTVAALTPEDVFAPTPPAGLTVTQGINTIELTWERGREPDLTTWNVYRATGEGPPERIALNLPNTVFSDTKVASGRRYRYTVTAVDNKGNESQPSAAVEVTGP